MVKKFNYSNIFAKTISCNTINNHIGLKKTVWLIIGRLIKHKFFFDSVTP